jgi:hypothetical protein
MKKNTVFFCFSIFLFSFALLSCDDSKDDPPGDTPGVIHVLTESDLQGAWKSDCIDNGGNGERITFEFSGSSLTQTSDEWAGDTTCAGGSSTSSDTNTYELMGESASISGAEKIYITTSKSPVSQVVKIDGNELYWGDDEGTLDSEGYPSTMAARVYYKI